MATSTRFTADDLSAITAALAVLEQRFAKLEALTPKERQRLFKMGFKTEKFCRETLHVLDKNRQLVPPAMDLPKALSALRTIDELRPLTHQLERMVQRMKDTQVGLGADVATAARQGYKSLSEYGGRHGLEGKRQALGVRFKRGTPANAVEGEGGEGAA